MFSVAKLDELASLLRGVVTDSAEGLRTAYDLAPRAARDAEASSILAIVGFTGEGLRGTIVFELARETIVASNTTTSPMRDWIAELANQLFGRIKNRLLPQGITIHAAPPAVVAGRYLESTERPHRQPPADLLLRIDLSFSTVWVEADVRLPVGDANHPEANEIPAEGDVLLF